MVELKDIGRAILGLLGGYLVAIFWLQARPGDPEYYPWVIGFVIALVVFLLLHFMGKEV